MNGLTQDLNYALRIMRRNPGFTLIAVITLALGIGATSAIFTLINAVLLKPLPWPEPERVVQLWETLPQGQGFFGTASAPNLRDWREQNDVFEKLAAFQYGSASLFAEGEPQRVAAGMVSAEFFDVVAMKPAMGRAFQQGEDQPGAAKVVILSDALWRKSFGADAGIVGQEISLDGGKATVVGVMPPGFRYPAGSLSTQGSDLWIPLVIPQDRLNSRGNHWLMVLGRLKPGVEFHAAQEQMKTIAARLEQQYPEQEKRSIVMFQLQQQMVRNFKPAALMLFGAVGFLLLIACTNVANLLLARATARQREIAIRSAIGAARARIVRQLLTESIVLSSAGAALGLVIAYFGLQGLLTIVQPFIPRVNDVTLDWRVVTFTLVLAMLTGIAAGLAPAVQGSVSKIQTVLKEGSGALGSAPAGWMRRTFAAVEVAAALILLVGAGLLIRSLTQLQQVDPGFKPQSVLTAQLALSPTKYDTEEKKVQFFDNLLRRLQTVPGVEAAGMINLLPVQNAGWNTDEVRVEGYAQDAGATAPLVEMRVASPEYFKALGVPLVSGRTFEGSDLDPKARVMIVNQAFVRALMKEGDDPIGKRVDIGDTDMYTIVGMCGDVKHRGLSAPAAAEMIFPHTTSETDSMKRTVTLVVRGNVEPTSLTSAIRREVQSVDPAQPIYNVQTMMAVIDNSLATSKVNTLLLGIFAAVATVLAMIGIYSLMSYMVLQQTREIGIRMALGAQQNDVMRMVMGRGLRITLIGLAVGGLGAFGLAKLISTLLFGVTPGDPLTFAAVIALLLFVALAACFIPAKRAMQVEPMVALRYE